MSLDSDTDIVMADWHVLTIMVPDYETIQSVLGHLKAQGFTEDDWCALNRQDGAHVSWGPMEYPGPRPHPWDGSR